MALQIENWPIRGLRLAGVLMPQDVDRLIDAILEHPESGATALHMEFVASIDLNAARTLKRRLDELWASGDARRQIFLHVVPGDVADVLLAAGFEEKYGPHPLIYMRHASEGA